MNLPASLPIAAAAGQPLFGNQWLALLAILAGVAVFMVVLAGIGRWLAATHPETPKKPAAPVTSPLGSATAAVSGISAEVLAVIASAVAVTVGSKARITAVVPIQPATPSVEMLMQQWSVEGRRQIYSSHQIR